MEMFDATVVTADGESGDRTYIKLTDGTYFQVSPTLGRLDGRPEPGTYTVLADAKCGQFYRARDIDGEPSPRPHLLMVTYGPGHWAKWNHPEAAENELRARSDVRPFANDRPMNVRVWVTVSREPKKADNVETGIETNTPVASTPSETVEPPLAGGAGSMPDVRAKLSFVEATFQICASCTHDIDELAKEDAVLKVHARFSRPGRLSVTDALDLVAHHLKNAEYK